MISLLCLLVLVGMALGAGETKTRAYVWWFFAQIFEPPETPRAVLRAVAGVSLALVFVFDLLSMVVAAPGLKQACGALLLCGALALAGSALARR